MQRPKKDSAHERLQDLNCHSSLFQAGIDLSPLLPRGHNLRDHLAALLHVAFNNVANALAGQKTRDQGTGEVGTASRLLGCALEEVVKHRLNGLLAVLGKRRGLSHFAKLNLSHHSKYVIFALEVVEEGSFAHVSSLRNVFYRDVGEAPFCKEMERTSE